MASGRKIVNQLWFALPDLVWMFVAVYLALFYKYGTSLTNQQVNLHLRVFSVLFAAWMVILFVHNLFDPKHLRRYTTLFFTLFSATLVNTLAAIVYFYFQPDLIITPRRFLLLTIALWFVLALCWHLFMKFILQQRISEGYFLFSLEGDLDELHKEILNHGYLGFKAIRYLTSVEQLESLDQPNINLIISERTLSRPEHARIVYNLRTKGANIVSQVDFYERLLRRVPLAYLDEPWFLRNIWTRTTRLERLGRRAQDILAGLIFGIIFIVTFPFIALAIKLTSAGPLFFVQLRVGLNGRPFMVYKYRTMGSDSTGRGWTKVNDPRVTPVGKFLRRTHLDELPQFVNLLGGSMSIVGPRPEQIEIVAELSKSVPFYNERHAINPGLTGWAQLNIYAGTLEESKLKLEYDLYYLKHRSIFFDLEIILKTLYSIFVNKLK